jgi:large subunit ribosomal protein L4
MNVSILGAEGGAAGEMPLSEEIFAARVNVPLMHQVVTAQLAAARAGTHSTKTRAEVRGGGRKPWRQKGTGRARHGSIREPQWVGGGIAFGPKPRDHSKAVPKKMKALALRSALSSKFAEGRVLVVDDPNLTQPSTKQAVKLLEAWGASGRVLAVLRADQVALAYSLRNIPHVDLISDDQLNTYDVLRADTVVFLRQALEAFQQRASVLPRTRAVAAPAPEADVVPDVEPDVEKEEPTPSPQATTTERQPAPAEPGTEEGSR